MIYEEYEAIRKRISKKEEKLFKLMEKRDNLFAMTQPKSSQFDDEIVDGKVHQDEQYNINENHYCL